MNSVGALAYHFCLALPAAFMQPGTHLLADPCMYLDVAESDPPPRLRRISVACADEVTEEIAVAVDELVAVETNIRVVDREAGQLPRELLSIILRFHNVEGYFTTEQVT